MRPNATTRIGQKVSKLGHDRPGNFCRAAEFHSRDAKIPPRLQSRVENSTYARGRHLPAGGATAREGVLIYLN